MCKIYKVSRSGYYKWKNSKESSRKRENKELLDNILRIYSDNREVYGYPRIHKALIKEGFKYGRNRVARLMKENNIVARPHRKMRKKRIYISSSVAENLVARQFKVNQPNRIWASDMTCFWSGSGSVYLAVVIDLYSRKVIGWAMHGRMTERLVIKALEMALINRRPQEYLIHHSDQGSQYQSHIFRSKLKKNNIEMSMSRKGNCYDNAVVESFFKTLKNELESKRFVNREEAKKKLFEYIEVFYNRRRLHSTLNYLSPTEFELNSVH